MIPESTEALADAAWIQRVTGVSRVTAWRIVNRDKGGPPPPEPVRRLLHLVMMLDQIGFDWEKLRDLDGNLIFPSEKG